MIEIKGFNGTLTQISNLIKEYSDRDKTDYSAYFKGDSLILSEE